MAQNANIDLVATATSGVQLAAWLNARKANFLSSNSGANAPSYGIAGTTWLETGTNTSFHVFRTSGNPVRIAGLGTDNKARLAIDDDGDTYIASGSIDDQIRIVIGGQNWGLIRRDSASSNSFVINGTSSKQRAMYIGGTNAVRIPAGTTAQRPTDGEAGDVRINTQLTRLEFHDGTNWRAPTGGGGGGTGITTIAAATDTSIANPANGHLLLYNATSSAWENHAVSGDVTITSAGAISLGAGVVAASELATGAVETAKLADRSVTGAKTALNTLQNTHLAGLSSAGANGQFVTVDGNNGFAYGTPTLSIPSDAVGVDEVNATGTASAGRFVKVASSTQFAYARAMTTANTVTASGNSVSFTITNDPHFIHVNFDQVRHSLVGNNNEIILVQLNQRTTGYNSGSAAEDIRVQETRGFVVMIAGSSDVLVGSMTIRRMSNGVWIASHSASSLGSVDRIVGGGGRFPVVGAVTSLQVRARGATYTLTGGNVDVAWM